MSPTVDHERIRQRLVRLVGVPSITGDEEAAVDLVADWLRDCADEVDRWTDSTRSLEAAEGYPGREVEREAVPWIRDDCRSPDIEIVTAGPFRGAGAAIRTLLRLPEVVTAAVAMSGVYEDEEESTFAGVSSRVRERFVLLAHGEGDS